MPKNYVLLETITVGAAGAASVTFNSIPQSGYTDLVVKGSARLGTTGIIARFNSDSGTNYSRTILRGNGSTADSTRQSNQNSIAIDGSYSQPYQNAIMHIMNYANTTTYKTTIQRSNNAGAGLDQGVGMWRNTAAITSIDVTLQTNNYTAGTKFTLYGIKAA